MFVRALVVALVLTVVPPLAAVSVVSIPEVMTSELDITVPASSASPARAGVRPVDVRRSAPIASSMDFTMVGFQLPEGVDTLRVRTAGDDGVWGEWYDLERVEPDEGPDADSEEGAQDRSKQYTEPVYVGAANRLQIETPAEVPHDVNVRASLLDTEGLSGGPTKRKVVQVDGPVAEASTTAPAYVTRDEWGAAPPKHRISYASKVDMTVIHHTAGNNDYTRAQAAGIVRGIQRWHMDNNGWTDIGYNALVDRFGTIYEGRGGGLEWAVIGAHAAGYNTGSFGVSVIGNFEKVDAPQAAYDALVRVISWKSWLHGMDPLGTTDRDYKGAPLRTISGHRDMGTTACPGLIKDRLWWIRTAASNNVTGLPPGPGNGEPLEPPPSAYPPAPPPEPTPAPGDPSSPVAPTPEPEEPTLADAERFPDVVATSVHRQNVLTAHDTGVLLGYVKYNTFDPGKPLNRGDMARAVAKAMGLQPAPWDDRFSDVPEGHWLAPWILALNDAGVVHGFPDGTFRMSEPLMRDQMATFLARSLKLPLAEPSFKDVGPGNLHRGAIGAVERAGVTHGISATEYGPRTTMRRDQSASLLVRAYGLQR